MSHTTVMPPDGGYGYLVMVTSWGGQVLVGTMLLSFATLMVELADHFKTSQATVALTGAMLNATLHVCGIFIGGLVHRFGSRLVCMGGSALCAISAVATSFATNIYVTYFTFGIIGGVGSSALVLSSIVILQQYFDSKRAITSGFASTGLAVGSLVVGPLYRVVIDRFGWRVAMMAHAGLLLQGMVIGATFRPLASRNAVPEDQKNAKDEKKTGWKSMLMGLIDMKLLHNKGFMLYLVSGIMWTYGLATMYNLSPSRAVSQGMDRFHASLIPSIIAIFSVVSRLVNSIIANWKCTNWFLQFGILCILSGVAICLSCTTTSLYGSAIFAGMFGVCMGGFLSVAPAALVELVGIDSVSRAQGLHMFVWVIPALVALPLGGWIYDETSNYNIAFMVGGVMSIAGGVCSSAIFVLRRSQKKEQRGKTTAENGAVEEHTI